LTDQGGDDVPIDWGGIFRAVSEKYHLGPAEVSKMTLAQVSEYLKTEEQPMKYGSLGDAVAAMKAKKNEAS